MAGKDPVRELRTACLAMAEAGTGPALEWFGLPIVDLCEWVELEADRQKKRKQ